MAYQPTGQGAKIACTFDGPLGTWTNVLWAYKEEFDVDDLQELATTVKKSLVDNLVDHMVVGVSLPTVIATDERAQNGPMRAGVYANGTGDITGDILPLSTSMVFTLRTDQRGRAYRGRIYLSGFGESQMFDGEWSALPIQDAWQALSILRTDILATGWTWGIRSGVLNGVERPFAIVTAITSIESRSAIPGTQRRRNRRP